MKPGRPSLPALLAAAHPARALLFAAALGLAGCSGATRPAAPPRSAREAAAPPPASAPAQAPKEKEQASASRPATSGSGVITRAELRRFLDRGPHAFIQRVQVRPSFRQRRFDGWRIIAYAGPGPVRPGDVVRRVNGQGLERPEHVMGAWSRLARSNELSVEIVRRGRRLILRWSIVD